MNDDPGKSSAVRTGLPRPDFAEGHPQNVPLDEWTEGWLKLGIAVHAGADYLWMNGGEKGRRGLPASKAEMVAYLAARGDVPAAGATRAERAHE